VRPIDELNQLPGREFQAALRPLFEAALPLAEALERRKPFASYAALLDEAERLLAQLPAAQQVEVLAAHPRIGERPASALSLREQGYDREPDDPRVLAELASLNQAYELQFGFRFVVYVNGRSRAEIVPLLRQRLANPREHELATGRRELIAIARSRLETLG
jgi:2-oxo-4-hydroxy-4-carboxy-5-ureidoimidazoline decarboxylase